MKSSFFKLSLLIFVPVLVFFSLVYSGVLSPSFSTSTPSMVTLSDINNLILNNVTTATSSDHSVSTTSSTVTTYVSVSELYANLANLILPEYVKTGETILGIAGSFAEPQNTRTQVSTSSTSLTPSASPEATGYTLQDIYTLINSNSTTTETNHSFTNSSSVSSSMRSLASLYSDLSSLIDPTHIATGTTYLGVTGTYFPSISGLIAHFKMNDNAGDTVVTNTLATSDTTHVAGKFGNAIDFAGDKYVNLGDNFGFDSGSFSVSMWVYVDGYISGSGDTPSTSAFLFCKDDDLNSRGYVLGITDSSGSHYSYIELGGSPTLTGVIDITSGSWHNITFTFDFDTGTYNSYIDGLFDSTAVSANPPVTGAVATLGRRLYTGNTEPLDGKLDDILVFNRVLSSEEISTIYNLGSGLEGNIENPPFNSGLTAGYHMSETTGTTVADFSGNSIAGTLVGFSDGNGVATQNTSLMYTTGKVNGALNFDGSNDWVSLGDLNTTPSSFTISTWAKRGDTASYDVLVSLGPTSYGNSLAVMDPGTILFGDLNDNYGVWESVWTDKTEFHHIVIIVETTGALQSARLYFDGVDQGERTNIDSDGSWNAAYIGRFDGGEVQGYLGSIDDIRIYNESLSESEVKALYFMGQGTEEE